MRNLLFTVFVFLLICILSPSAKAVDNEVYTLFEDASIVDIANNYVNYSLDSDVSYIKGYLYDQGSVATWLKTISNQVITVNNNLVKIQDKLPSSSVNYRYYANGSAYNTSGSFWTAAANSLAYGFKDLYDQLISANSYLSTISSNSGSSGGLTQSQLNTSLNNYVTKYILTQSELNSSLNSYLNTYFGKVITGTDAMYTTADGSLVTGTNYISAMYHILWRFLDTRNFLNGSNFSFFDFANNEMYKSNWFSAIYHSLFLLFSRSNDSYNRESFLFEPNYQTQGWDDSFGNLDWFSAMSSNNFFARYYIGWLYKDFFTLLNYSGVNPDGSDSSSLSWATSVNLDLHTLANVITHWVDPDRVQLTESSRDSVKEVNDKIYGSGSSLSPAGNIGSAIGSAGDTVDVFGDAKAAAGLGDAIDGVVSTDNGFAWFSAATRDNLDSAPQSVDVDPDSEDFKTHYYEDNRDEVLSFFASLGG